MFIKDLNLRPETIKLLEENVGGKLLDISLRQDLWNWYQKQSQQK